MTKCHYTCLDCHTHVARDLRERSHFEDATPETLLCHMKQHHIRYAFVYATYINSQNDMTNEEVKDLVEQHAPDLIGVGAIDIHHAAETFAQVKRFCTDGTFKAVKLYPTYQEYHLDDPLLDGFYSFCQEKMIPVIVHIGTCRKTSFKVKPQEVEDLIARYPTLMIVIAHFGMPYVKQTLELMTRHQDKPVYVDTSCLWPGQAKDFLRKLLNYYKGLGLSTGRVLFGTDFPLSDANEMIDQIDRSELTDDEKRDIFYTNAMKLFRITRPYRKEMFSETINEVMIFPSYQCNNQCAYCFDRHSKRSDRQMSLDDFTKILVKAKKENVLKLSFLGGEPTLWPCLNDAIAMTKETGIKVGIYTNGTGGVETLSHVDDLRLHLDTADDDVRQTLEGMARKSFQLHGIFTATPYLDLKMAAKVLSHSESYSSITFILDRTEISPEQNQRNFDKVAVFKDHPKVEIAVIVPFCQFRHDQKMLIRTDNHIVEYSCFPGWKRMIVDNEMNVKNCFATTISQQFNDDIPFAAYRNIFDEKTQQELNTLPFEQCGECFDYRSGSCYGGCQHWKEAHLQQSLIRH